jgi:nucleotide-binding universal stress UspA family protein
MKTFLVPVDFSAATDATLATAVNLAKACAGELVLLHVLGPADDYRSYPPGGSTLWELEKTRARRNLHGLVSSVREQGVAVSSRVLSGEAVEQIVAQARESCADAIVMGSRGHTAIYDLLIGSTTSGVLKAGVCPVLLAPMGKPAGVVRQA